MSNAYLSPGHGCSERCACFEERIRPRLTCVAIAFLGLTLVGCRERPGAYDTAQTETESRFGVRILLLRHVPECTVHVPPDFSIKHDSGGAAVSQIKPKEAGAGSVSIPVCVRNGRICIADHAYEGRELEIWPGTSHVFGLDQYQYRGRIRIVLCEDGHALDLINLVPLEAYLAGVVGAEMPAFWRAEALKVQAVVSRTYCLYIMRRFGRQRSWDLNKTQAHQVYQGLRAEHPRIWDAVNSTRGQCLTGPGPDGAYAIFPTYYSAICGGHTESSEHVFGEASAPLSGVSCSYCKDVAKLGQFLWPMASYAKQTVSDQLLRRYKQLRSLERIVGLTPIRQSDYSAPNRITSFRLTGSNGRTDHLRAEDLRLCIDPGGRAFRSTMCRMADWGDRWAFVGGRGWGHGVGLCQCGAQGLAKQGRSYQAILQYYYPGSRIISIYDN